MEKVIDISNVSKTYSVSEKKVSSTKFLNIFSWFNKSKNKRIHALKDVNFSVEKGEIFGIVGRNGSGKSTLMNIILGAIKPDKGGKVLTDGKMIKLSLGIGVDKNLTARENIYLNGSILGLSFKEIGSKFDDIIKFSGLEQFVDTQVKFYSKGMKSRLLFSIAIHAEADIFLLDEFFGGVGDKNFKQKSEDVFNESIVNKKTIVIISHSLKTIERFCTRTLWIEKGQMKMLGPTKEVLNAYKASFED